MRLGSIDFINSLPVDYGILSGELRPPFEIAVTRAVPSALNRMLGENRLDVSPVSSLFYAMRAADLRIVPGVSVSSRSGVRSVLLFSARPMEALDGCRIAVTPKGIATPVLLRILLKRRYGVRAVYTAHPEPLELLRKGHAEAALVIGDEALLAARNVPPALTAIDLGAEWKSWTGLPFVFAVWAARREYADARPSRFEALGRLFAESRAWGASHPDAIREEAARRTGLAPAVLNGYFNGLSFDFGDDLKQGLERYAAIAAEEGFADAALEAQGFYAGTR